MWDGRRVVGKGGGAVCGRKKSGTADGGGGGAVCPRETFVIF